MLRFFCVWLMRGKSERIERKNNPQIPYHDESYGPILSRLILSIYQWWNYEPLISSKYQVWHRDVASMVSQNPTFVFQCFLKPLKKRAKLVQTWNGFCFQKVTLTWFVLSRFCRLCGNYLSTWCVDLSIRIGISAVILDFFLFSFWIKISNDL